MPNSIRLAILLAAVVSRASAQGLVAFSLAAAERQLSDETAAPTARVLGGITKLVGMVYDASAKDIILIGEIEKGRLPLRLDDLAVAARAVLKRHEWPVVSIDPTADTPVTKKQAIRFEGGIENSSLGADLLAADVVLKKLALGLLTHDKRPLPSYFDLSVALEARGKMEARGQSRLWFYAAEPVLEERDGVFAIRSLRIAVQSQTAGGSAVRDEAADKFSAILTEAYPELAQEYAELDRLGALYQIVAVCNGLESVPAERLAFWLDNYQPASVETARSYDLISRKESIRSRGGRATLEIAGGVLLKTTVIRLQDGDIGALRDVVLLARPDVLALSWELPIRKWDLGTGTVEVDRTAIAALQAPPGSSLERRLSAGGNASKPPYEPRVIVSAAPPPPVEAASSMYRTAEDGTHRLTNPGGSIPTWSGGGRLCMWASCLGTPQHTSDGIIAEPYAYFTGVAKREFNAGWTVRDGERVIGNGYGDVKLLGRGRFAATGWNDGGYRVYDENGKATTGRLIWFQALGDGYYASVERLGMMTIRNRDNQVVREIPAGSAVAYAGNDRIWTRVAGNETTFDATSASRTHATEPAGAKPAGTRGGISIDIKMEDK